MLQKIRQLWCQNEHGNRDSCIQAAQNCMEIHKNYKNVAFRARCKEIVSPCLCLVPLNPVSQFQETALKGKDKSAFSVKSFL